LLLLRVVIGVTSVAQGATYVTAANSTVWLHAAGVLAITTGASLVVGFLTPGASAIVGFGTFALTLVPSSAPYFPTQADTLSSLFVVTDAAVITLLGPGAFSLDARLFGRREIIISHKPHSFDL
jgi:uncharacterized membrane protein YphA (DoxX/SURF4 family)